MKLTIKVEDASFLLKDEDLLLVKGKLVHKMSLSLLDREIYEQTTPSEWSALDTQTQFELVQACAENWLTAVSGGQLVYVGPVTF